METNYSIPKKFVGGAGNRGGVSSRGGGPSNVRADMSHLADTRGKDDRFCSWCRGINARQAHRKPNACDKEKCGRNLPLRGGGWSTPSGWGRCADCDSFIHKAHHYCQLCGTANADALIKNVETESKELKRKLVEKEGDIRNLKKRLDLLEEKKTSAEDSVLGNLSQENGNGTNDLGDSYCSAKTPPDTPTTPPNPLEGNVEK